MENLPVVEGETDSTEPVSTESPPENVLEEIEYENADELETGEWDEQEEGFVSSASPEDKEEFERRVTNLMQLMADDSAIRDRVLAEIYVNIASAEQGIRGVFEMVQQGGMAGIARGMFRRKG